MRRKHDGVKRHVVPRQTEEENGGGGRRGSLSAVLTRHEYGNCARICDEYIQLSKMPNDALHGTSCALHVKHVRSKHEHIRARNGSYDQVSRLI
jgi:hypothetical protein